MISLRTRLLAGTIGSMVLLLTVLSLLVYVAIRRALYAQFDAGLESTARLIAGVIEQDVDEVELGLEVQQMPEFRDVRHQAYFQLWGPGRTVLAKSPSLRDENLWRIDPHAVSPAFADSYDRDGRSLRAVGLRFLARPGENDREPPLKLGPITACLTVARDATELHGQLRFLGWLLGLASGAATALALLLATLVVRHGLAPLHAIATQIGAIRAQDLTARIDTRGTPQEIAPIRDRLNDLLARLQASFQRERRFTADVAHELRTPLAGLRSTIDVTLLRARASREYQAVLADCLEIVQNMQAMVNNLLMLARLDARQMVLHRERLGLADLVNGCWRPLADRARQRHLTFETTVSDDLTCLSDRDNLAMVVSNILANAAEYTNENGRVWATAQQGSGIELTIANTGCSLTQEQVGQVFDCFWRGDAARREAGAHCGLGLALVQRLVTALGGSATAELQAGGIFVVRIRLDEGPAANR